MKDTSVGCLLHTPLTGDLSHNPGICLDWESNRLPFNFQASTQSTEPHQLGQYYEFKAYESNVPKGTGGETEIVPFTNLMSIN